MSEKYNNYNDSGYEINYAKIYNAVKKGIIWIIFTSIFFVLFSIIYVQFIAVPIYTSEAKILLSESGKKQSSLSNFASQLGFALPTNYGNSDMFLTIESLPEILKSRSLTKSLLFSDFQTNSTNDRQILLNIIFDQREFTDIDSNRLISSGEKYITNRILDVQQVKNTPIISLYANTPYPELSAQILLRVILELNRMQLEYSRQELGDQKNFLFSRIVEIGGELYKAEYNLRNFRENNIQINMSPSLLLEQERLEREIDIQTELYIALKQKFEQIKIDENRDILPIKIIDNPNVPFDSSKPQKKLIVVISGLVGLMIGFMFSLIRYYDD